MMFRKGIGKKKKNQYRNQLKKLKETYWWIGYHTYQMERRKKSVADLLASIESEKAALGEELMKVIKKQDERIQFLPGSRTRR